MSLTELTHLLSASDHVFPDAVYDACATLLQAKTRDDLKAALSDFISTIDDTDMPENIYLKLCNISKDIYKTIHDDDDDDDNNDDILENLQHFLSTLRNIRIIRYITRTDRSEDDELERYMTSIRNIMDQARSGQTESRPAESSQAQSDQAQSDQAQSDQAESSHAESSHAESMLRYADGILDVIFTNLS